MNAFFKGMLEGLNTVFGNYGWSIMAFTLLIRLILFPFDYKSRVSMRKTTKLQPELARLPKKYANDKNKLNQKTSELYRKEHINPLSSCLPMLLSMPILFIMFAAMRSVAYEQLAGQTMEILSGAKPQLETWLWIKNLWMPDNPFSTCMPDLDNLRIIGADIWQTVVDKLSPEQLSAVNATLANAGATLTISSANIAELFNGAAAQETLKQMLIGLNSVELYRNAVTAMPGLGNINLLFWNLSITNGWNGLLLLPVLSAVSQFVMTMLQPTQPSVDNAQQQSTNNFMKWFFPLFSLFICLNYTAAFALYWVTSNLAMMVQMPIVNKLIDIREAKKEAAKVEGTVK